VGYFVLGPSDLYKLVKEIGKFLQNIRALGTDLTKTFETNMNDVVQIEELRKAQRELNDAFSFRRTINVDSDSEAFTYQAGSAQQNEMSSGATMMMETTTTPNLSSNGGGGAAAVAVPATAIKKKVRRRVLKKTDPFVMSTDTFGLPDLEMPFAPIDTPLKLSNDDFSSSSSSSSYGKEPKEMTADEIADIEREFNQYTMFDEKDDRNAMSYDNGILSTKQYYDEVKEKQLSNNDNDNKSVSPLVPSPKQDTMSNNELSRFQQQLSGNWNQQVMANADKLEPITVVMNKIALLEQERIATLNRLTEEFDAKKDAELNFYKQQRDLLDQAAVQIQENAFGISSTKFSKATQQEQQQQQQQPSLTTTTSTTATTTKV
jgi:Sec-independent protein translocase protein TatA